MTWRHLGLRVRAARLYLGHWLGLYRGRRGAKDT
jgi:hypothetical protein